MSCGCDSPCGCNVVGLGYVDVTREGDTFKVSVDMPIRFVEDTDCIGLTVDPETRTLRAAPILALADDQDASLQLRCSDDGLTGDVVIDPASSAPVSLTSSGLRVDLPPPPASPEQADPGSFRLTASVQANPGWLDADGSEVSRNTLPALHDALSLVSTNGERTLGSAQVTGVPTRHLKAGMDAEIDGFPPGLVVASIDSPYTLSLNAVATSSGVSDVRVYPYGNGDGADTFNLPLIGDDEFVKQMAPGEGLGTGGGSSSTTLAIANLPPHEHPGTTATDSGHGHPGSTASSGSTSTVTSMSIAMDSVPSHNHQPATARDSNFVTVLKAGFDAADYIAIPTVAGLSYNPGTGDGALLKTEAVSIPTEPDADAGIIDYAQGNRAFTSDDGGHTPTVDSATGTVTTTTGTTVTIASGSANIAVDVAVEGSGTAFENRPAFRAYRWQVKT